MITKTSMDEGCAFDWGKTSPDYAMYRPGYPHRFIPCSRQLALDDLDNIFWIWGLALAS